MNSISLAGTGRRASVLYSAQRSATKAWRRRVIEGFRFTGDASRAVDDQGLALLAAEYVEALAAGEHAGHVLAERHGVKLARIKQLLHRARQHELLTSAPRGKQGGDLTARARALLEG